MRSSFAYGSMKKEPSLGCWIIRYMALIIPGKKGLQKIRKSTLF